MSDASHSHRRTKKFINGWAQMSIAVEVVIHALLLVALLALLLFAPPFVTMFSDYSVEDHQAVARDLYDLNRGKWPLFVALAAFIGFVSILFSHHIVGPAFHLRRVLSELLDRNLKTRVRFRKWDYLSDIEPQFNQVIERWNDDIAAIQRDQKLAHKTLEELRSDLGPKAKDLEDRLNAIGQVVDRYQGTHPEEN